MVSVDGPALAPLPVLPVPPVVQPVNRSVRAVAAAAAPTKVDRRCIDDLLVCSGSAPAIRRPVAGGWIFEVE
jgi:hypothetical protein